MQLFFLPGRNVLKPPPREDFDEENALLLVGLLLPGAALGQDAPPVGDPIGEGATTLIDEASGMPVPSTVRLVVLLTALTFLPAILLVMTPFTRFVIVFSLLRQALGLQQRGNKEPDRSISVRCADRIVATLAEWPIGSHSTHLLAGLAEHTGADLLPAVPRVAAFLRRGRASVQRGHHACRHVGVGASIFAWHLGRRRAPRRLGSKVAAKCLLCSGVRAVDAS